MYRTERQPAWQRDVAWASAVLLALTALVGTLFFSLSQLSDRATGQEVQREVLRLSLRPGQSGAGLLEVRTGAGYVAGQPLMLVPGLRVFADASEVPSFTVDEALGRGAGVLADRLVGSGSASLLELVDDGGLARQFQAALAGPVPALVEGAIGQAMVGGGLDDGTRTADWPAQAAANPGQPVQPLVGVFVTFPVEQVRNMTDRQIGAAIVAELSADVLEGGLPQALAVVTNENVRGRLTSGVNNAARARLHELFTTMLAANAAVVEGRLAEARAVLAGDAETEEEALAGLLPAAELAGLSEAEAEERVLAALAERAWQGGGSLAAAQLTRQDQAERVSAAAPVLDRFSARAHGRYLTYSWLAGLGALLFAVLLVGFSRGLLRLMNPGVALTLGAGLGALGFYRLDALLPAADSLPAGAAAQGVYAALVDLFAFGVRALPTGLVAVPLRNYLVVGGLGAALVVLALLLWLLRGVRPRRRRFR